MFFIVYVISENRMNSKAIRAAFVKHKLDYVLTLRLLHTAEDHCPAMSQRATIELRVLYAGLMYSTSLRLQYTANDQCPTMYHKATVGLTRQHPRKL